MRIRCLLLIVGFILPFACLSGATLTVTKDGGGDGHIRVNGVDQTLPFSQSYAAGTSLTLEAVPAFGSQFEWWSGSISSTNNPVTFTMPLFGNVNVAASFSLSPPDIDAYFSSWWVGQALVGSYTYNSITLRNLGGMTLIVVSTTITGANASEFIIQSGGGAFNLAPGVDHNIEVRFIPASAGYKYATLSITSNDADENPFQIGLSAKGDAPDIASNPADWDFGSVSIGDHSEKTFAVRNDGDGILLVSSTALTGSSASEFTILGGGGSYQLDPGTSRDVTVRFTPTGTGGKSASLTFNSNDPDENPFNIGLSGTGVVPGVTAPDIASNPVGWDFGSVNKGSHSEKTFSVRNDGNADLSVSSTALTGLSASEFSIQSGGGAFNLAAGASRDVTVRFAPTSAGSKNARLSFATNDPDENPFYIDLAGFGIAPSGGAPDIDISPAALNANNAATLDLIIRNTGNADLTFGIHEDNLLQNSGFESGFEPWIEEDWVNAGTIVRDNAERHSGSWSAKITGDRLVNSWELQLKQCGVQVQDRQAYSVSFWAKAQKARTVAVGLCKETSGWNDVSERYTASLKTSWQRFASTLHVNIPAGVPNPLPPADTRFFFSEIGTDLTPFWIDDVKLQAAAKASGWLCCESTAGTVGPGSQKTVRLSFDPGALANGTYQADLVVQSNDPDEPSVTVPVRLTVTGSAVENPEDRGIPHQVALHPNYPNPFNTATTIRYAVPRTGLVKMAVYNLQGLEVAVLVNGTQAAGSHAVRFDASELASGIYVCRIETLGQSQSKKLMLLK